MPGQQSLTELQAALTAALGPYAVTGDGDSLDSSLEVMATLISLGWLPPPELRKAWLDRLSQDAVRAGAPAASHGPPSQPPATHWSRVYRPLNADPAADPAETAARARERANRFRALLAAADHLARAAAPPQRWLDPTLVRRAGRARSSSDEEVQQLQEALTSRPPIEHAVGMFMIALSCGPERGWRALVALSQATNRRVRDTAALMAEQVAAEALRPAHLVASVSGLLGTGGQSPGRHRSNGHGQGGGEASPGTGAAHAP